MNLLSTRRSDGGFVAKYFNSNDKVEKLKIDSLSNFLDQVKRTIAN